MKQLEIEVTKTTVPANEKLGREEKTLYYILIGGEKETVIVNVGKNNHDLVELLLKKVKDIDEPKKTK